MNKTQDLDKLTAFREPVYLKLKPFVFNIFDDKFSKEWEDKLIFAHRTGSHTWQPIYPFKRKCENIYPYMVDKVYTKENYPSYFDSEKTIPEEPHHLNVIKYKNNIKLELATHKNYDVCLYINDQYVCKEHSHQRFKDNRLKDMETDLSIIPKIYLENGLYFYSKESAQTVKDFVLKEFPEFIL